MSLQPVQLGFTDEGFEVADVHLDLDEYDRIVVAFSGGKDSVACYLELLERGVDRRKIELHHHLVDGREGSTLMDWPVTEAYCKAFAQAFGSGITFSWREGGFEREMLRNGNPTAPVFFPGEQPGEYVKVGGNGPAGIRRKFPQVTASLSQRWCSSYAKIDCCARYLTNHSKFQRGKTLVVTGERAEESSARAKYAEFEAHRSDNRTGKNVRRWIDHWRPVHKWTESQVWELIEKYKVQAHPAYYLGWGRTSCLSCIFGGPNQWASVKELTPVRFYRISEYEKEFGVTIARDRSVEQQAARGRPYPMDPRWKAVAMSESFDLLIFLDVWMLPSGAYAGETCGPT